MELHNVVSNAGVKLEHRTYDSFGNVKAVTDGTGASRAVGDMLTTYAYTGQRYEARTYLYDYHARWYDPRNGRFISEDPSGFDGGQDMNLYRYVGNNPYTNTDPTGLRGNTAFAPLSIGSSTSAYSPLRDMMSSGPGGLLNPQGAAAGGYSSPGGSGSLTFSGVLSSKSSVDSLNLSPERARQVDYDTIMWERDKADQSWARVRAPLQLANSLSGGNVEALIGDSVLGYVQNLMYTVRTRTANDVLSGEAEAHPIRSYYTVVGSTLATNTPGFAVVGRLDEAVISGQKLDDRAGGVRDLGFWERGWSGVQAGMEATMIYGGVQGAMRLPGATAVEGTAPLFRTWNEFQAGTKGQFASRAAAGEAWGVYKEANGITTGVTRPCRKTLSWSDECIHHSR